MHTNQPIKFILELFIDTPKCWKFTLLHRKYTVHRCTGSISVTPEVYAAITELRVAVLEVYVVNQKYTLIHRMCLLLHRNYIHRYTRCIYCYPEAHTATFTSLHRKLRENVTVTPEEHAVTAEIFIVAQKVYAVIPELKLLDRNLRRKYNCCTESIFFIAKACVFTPEDKMFTVTPEVYAVTTEVCIDTPEVYIAALAVAPEI
ncbi:hypothetical protein DINM_003812 [Dirofilaria immitis]|nr:hypothetical protein [Dirofilaria immitis]